LLWLQAAQAPRRIQLEHARAGRQAAVVQTMREGLSGRSPRITGGRMTSPVNRYSGLRGKRVYHSKYADCEHSLVRGITVRLLTPAEIEEFRAHIERCIGSRGQMRRRFQ
jgi:hypothetical protein